MKWLCKIGLHKWVYFDIFDTRRKCCRCGKQQTHHLTWDYIGRWL